MSTSIIYTKQSSLSPDTQWNGNNGGYRLIIEVTSATEISPKIFIFQKFLQSEGSIAYDDFFYSIASVAELSSVSEDAPAIGEIFYRTNSIDLVFGSFETMTLALARIEQTIQDLALANNEFGNLSVAETVTVTG